MGMNELHQLIAKLESIKQENTSEDKGNIAGYLNTIDEYVEMLFKGSKDTDTSEIAYRIQNAVDDIRMRELGLKPSNIRSKYNKIENEDNQNEDAHNDLNILTQKLYNILSDEQEKGYPSLPDDAHDSAEDLIGHLGEFMARLHGDQGAFDQ